MTQLSVKKNTAERSAFEEECRITAELKIDESGLQWAYCANRFWLAIEPEDQAMTPWLKSDGFWESWVSVWVLNNVDSETKFIDVGSNIGYFSFLAASCGAEVLAIDPNPRVVSLLNCSIQRNGEDFDVSTCCGAVSDRPEFVGLQIPLGHSGGASVANQSLGSSQWTTSTTLDTIFLSRGIGNSKVVVKIDVEGHELRVIDGFMNTLKSLKDFILIVEWDSARFSDWEEILIRLRSKFDLYLLDGAGLEREVGDKELAGLGLQMITLRPLGSTAPKRKNSEIHREISSNEKTSNNDVKAIIVSAFQSLVRRDPSPAEYDLFRSTVTDDVSGHEIRALLSGSPEVQYWNAHAAWSCLAKYQGPDLFFLHLPRTGGTSLRAMIEQATGIPVMIVDRDEVVDSRSNDVNFPVTRVSESKRIYWPLKEGHVSIRDVDANARVISIARDSRTRMISECFFTLSYEYRQGHNPDSDFLLTFLKKRLRVGGVLWQFVGRKAFLEDDWFSLAPRIQKREIKSGLNRIVDLVWQEEEGYLSKLVDKSLGVAVQEVSANSTASVYIDENWSSFFNGEAQHLLEQIVDCEVSYQHVAMEMGLLDVPDLVHVDKTFESMCVRYNLDFSSMRMSNYERLGL